MLKRYIELNGTKHVVACKEGERVWQVYVGVFDGITMRGFREGEPFTTKRGALAFADLCRELLSSVS